jgi:DNA-binding winged helix-turn-helix (wHTH) protein
LIYLIKNRERVVSKDDLIASVWGGRIVSDSTLNTRIHSARKAVGDSADQQRMIRTVPRKGFRFVAEIQQNADTAAPPSMVGVSVAAGAVPLRRLPRRWTRAGAGNRPPATVAHHWP